MRLHGKRLLLLLVAWLYPFVVPATEATDYGNASHWMYAPGGGAMPVDVFYLYPTSWTFGASLWFSLP